MPRLVILAYEQDIGSQIKIMVRDEGHGWAERI